MQSLCALTGLPSPHGAYLETRLRRPTPRVAEGLTVRGLASGGIDISDGLAADLAHLLTQSGCGATVYLERLPLSPALRALDDPDRRRALALAGGDDYELCFTVPPQQRPMLESRWRGAPMTSIGRIEASPGLRWICADGSTYHPPREVTGTSRVGLTVGDVSVSALGNPTARAWSAGRSVPMATRPC